MKIEREGNITHVGMSMVCGCWVEVTLAGGRNVSAMDISILDGIMRISRPCPEHSSNPGLDMSLEDELDDEEEECELFTLSEGLNE